MANEQLLELERKFEAEKARLQEEEKKKELENKIIDEYPQQIPPINPPVEPVKGLMESQRQDYSNEQIESTTGYKPWFLVANEFFQSMVSKTFLMGIFLMGLALTHPEITLEQWGVVFTIYGTIVVKGQSDKIMQNKIMTEKIKITPLNDSIMNELKKVIPVQGLG